MKNIVNRLIDEELTYEEPKRPLYHRNCAEILLMSADEKYDLKIDEKVVKSVCPFGGGMQSGKTCGALLGAMGAIGIMYTEERPSLNEKMKNITKEFVKEFEKEFSSTECECIKLKHRSQTEGCKPVMMRTADVLEKVVRPVVA